MLKFSHFKDIAIYHHSVVPVVVWNSSDLLINAEVLIEFLTILSCKIFQFVDLQLQLN